MFVFGLIRVRKVVFGVVMFSLDPEQTYTT